MIDILFWLYDAISIELYNIPFWSYVWEGNKKILLL